MSQKTIITTAVVIIVCIVITGLVFMIGNPGFLNRESSGNGLFPESEIIPQNTIAVTPVPVGTTFKDGTYTASGRYNSPAGSETITVTVTLQDNVITQARVVGNADHPKSKTYQSLFIQGIGSRVNGRKITEITSLGNVNGSSLTGFGFLAALKSIMDQAL
ncbi:MAG: hypothetical protein QY314_04575 [Candidatus Dojkabacteria bacterium]|nr:MAG: hypothetical protein QY314_04575 [Candidatus Dojkabacteria bacterium]